MPAPDPEPSAYDEFLDRLLDGDILDASEFLKRHPELSETECRQIREICGLPDPGAATATTGSERTSTQADSPPLERVGGYRLKQKIGAGGMGVVFIAEDEALGRDVAIKVLGPDLAGKEERAKRFLREIRAVAKLRHPNIVVVHGSGEQDGFRYMVMEYVPGSSLQDVVAAAAAHGTRLAAADAVRWGIEVGRALHEAHAAGLVHRDVKPSNIRITTGGRAVLLDFGLAQEAGAASLTESGGFRGSPQYASPEQVADDRAPVDVRTDVYSLGATLYEVLTGVAPFRGETRAQLFHAILTRDPVPPRRLEPSIPRDLETVILAAIEKDPARRYAAAAALVADLEAVREGRPISIRPISAAGRLTRWARRQPAKASLAATLVVGTLLVSALGGYIAANRGKIAAATAAERSRKVAALLQEAFLEYGEGVDAARARLLFEEALHIDPDCEEAQAGVAMSRTALGDPQGALALLDELASLRTTRPWDEVLRADALAKLGRSAEAKTINSNLDRPCTALDYFILGSRLLNRYHGGERSAKPAFEQLRLAVLHASAANERYFHQLGHAAWHAGRSKDAREIADAIGQLFPHSEERWLAIGMTLTEADPEQSIVAYEKAARAPPRSLVARASIVGRLSKSNRDDLVDLALEIARAMVAEAPDHAESHAALGTALEAKHALKGAIVEFREAVRLRPDLGQLDLAEALVEDGNYEDAIEPARAEARLRPFEARPPNLLGIALLHLGRSDEAIASFETALRLLPNQPHTLCNLGRALLGRGEFVRGLEHLRKGHEIGSKDPEWKYPSAGWVASAKELVALENRLVLVRRGEGGAPTATDWVVLAREVCARKRLFAEAARFYAQAFELDSSLTARRAPDDLLDAASCAVRAGLGAGDDPPQDASARDDLRARARGWLVERLEACEELVENQPANAASVAATLEAWRRAPGLAGVRGLSAAATMPSDEARAWRALWDRLDRLAPESRKSAPESR